MNKFTLEELRNTLTEEQIKAVEKCHNSYFIAMMSDNYDITLREERQALEELKKHIPNLRTFIGDFYNGNDTLIFND